MDRPAGDSGSSSTEPVLFQRNGYIGEITLNRPDKRNAISPEMARLIEAALRTIEEDEHLRVGLLSANGDRAFSAGADLSFIASGDGARLSTEAGGFGGIARFRRTKPLVCAVQGFALAGGFEIAIACDIVVADQSAVFGLPETTRGLIANGGGLIRLPRVLPRPIAMDVILTGRRLTAAEALHYGVISRVVEVGQVLSTAHEIAELIASLDPAPVAASIAIADLAANPASDEVWTTCARLADEIRLGDAAVAGARQFLALQ